MTKQDIDVCKAMLELFNRAKFENLTASQMVQNTKIMEAFARLIVVNSQAEKKKESKTKINKGK